MKIKKFENLNNIPELRKVEKKVIIIDSEDFDNWVNSIYEFLNYEFVAEQEASNDSCYKFNADKLRYDFDDFIQFKNGIVPRYLRPSKLFNYLVEDGYLEPGTYIVEVSW